VYVLDFSVVYYGGWALGILAGIARYRFVYHKKALRRELFAIAILLTFLFLSRFFADSNTMLTAERLTIYGISMILFGYSRNTGFLVFGFGTYSNTFTVLANNFRMPVSQEAMEVVTETANAIGVWSIDDSTHVILNDTHFFKYLTDIIPMIDQGPSVASIGDIMIYAALPGLIAGPIISVYVPQLILKAARQLKRR